MKLFRILIIFLIPIIPSIAPAQALKTTIADILSNKDKYHGEIVQVEGKVTLVHFTISKKGNPYTVFTLTDPKGNFVNVFGFDHLPVKKNESVRVTGKYQKVKHVPPNKTYYNQIDTSPEKVEKIR